MRLMRCPHTARDEKILRVASKKFFTFVRMFVKCTVLHLNAHPMLWVMRGRTAKYIASTRMK